MAKTPFGRHLKMIGGNEQATYRAGIRVTRNLIIAFILAGAIAGMAGWLLTIRTSGATANLGVGLLFNAFAAVVIGGVSLKGGVGALPGVYAGVLLLSSINTAINLMGLPANFTQVIHGLLVLAGGLALADLASGDGYGSAVSLPWSIELWGAARHPTQVYQLIAVGLIAAIVLKIDRVFDGLRFGLSIALYAASRLIIEAFRGDSAVINGVRTAQVWSLLGLLVALWVLRHWATAPVAASAHSSTLKVSGDQDQVY